MCTDDKVAFFRSVCSFIPNGLMHSESSKNFAQDLGLLMACLL